MKEKEIKVLDEEILNYLPGGEGSEQLIKIMESSRDIIRESRIIEDARDEYRGNPTDVWLWGGGRRPWSCVNWARSWN